MKRKTFSNVGQKEENFTKELFYEFLDRMVKLAEKYKAMIDEHAEKYKAMVDEPAAKMEQRVSHFEEQFEPSSL